ncbi:ABC transporter permease [Gelria sp. Kuro-4]|uniref:ABC transporter permease n=1 Tax=Gelria sp. Kuro-4 TaxID=2796927 RepID=UPI001BF09602|nr:ABC transporter permease [Gelria sp. Kuro-4]MDK2927534.1 peptide/nickel transport system permease protein [Bacillota bacterium]BCV23585.1 peptide ABC transporter substrate-binding protein [Gelria sp. Kuro-4]
MPQVQVARPAPPRRAWLSPATRRELARQWYRFRKRPVAVIGLVIVLAFVAVALITPWIAPYDPLLPDFAQILTKPGPQHLLGTDELGRDILSRILYGSQISLLVGLVAVGLAALVGVPLGLTAGYYGGTFDNVVMRIIDVLMAFPSILLAIVIVSILGPNLQNAVIAVGVFTVPAFARLARGEVLSIKNQEYIEAARAMGASDLWILAWHILPNIISPLIVWSTLNVSSAILTAAGLGFLGLGAQPPSPEWGAMLAKGREYLLVAPHLTTYTGLAILLLALGLNLLGDGLRDILDPKLKE